MTNPTWDDLEIEERLARRAVTRPQPFDPGTGALPEPDAPIPTNDDEGGDL